MKRAILLLFVVTQCLVVAAQGQAVIDSLGKATVSGPDTLRIQAMIELGRVTYKKDTTKALVWLDKAVRASQKGNHDRLLSVAYYRIGVLYSRHKRYDLVPKYYKLSVEASLQAGDKLGAADRYDRLCSFYYGTSRYPEAITASVKALTLFESLQDTAGVIRSKTILANVAFVQGNYKQAGNYYKELLQLARTSAHGALPLLLKSTGVNFRELGEYDSAMHYLATALPLLHEQERVRDEALCLSDIGEVYRAQGDPDKALEFFEKGLGLLEEVNYLWGMDACNVNIGKIYAERGEHRKALQYFGTGYEVAQQINCLQDQELASLGLAQSYAALGQYEKAYSYHNAYIQVKDSILNEQSQRQIVEMETKYQSDKKNLEIQALEGQQAAKDAKLAAKDQQIKRQESQRMALGVGIALMVILALVVFRSYRRKKNDNQLIHQQKKEVEHQKELVEEKNREITDSINYAQRIQEAILPPDRLVKECLADSFILYKPKDIVAGDFYWMEVVGETYLFAAADCTGHGVPGAMVSVVCYNALNRSVREFGLTDPGKILDKTRELVIETFEKSDHDVNDGMDIALCAMEGNVVRYAGANNPLLVYRVGIDKVEQVEEVKADKQPIGRYAEAKPFTTHTVRLSKGDVFYIFTDGYADQFGGEKEKKLKYKPFKQLLLDGITKPSAEQSTSLDIAFEHWRGELEQVDDVCIIGIRMP